MLQLKNNLATLKERSRAARQLSETIDQVQAADDVRLHVLPQTPLELFGRALGSARVGGP